MANGTGGAEAAGENHACQSIRSCLELATSRAKRLMEILDGSTMRDGAPDTTEVLRMVQEISVSLEQATNANRAHEYHDAIRETQQSTRALAQSLASAPTLDAQRVRMAAAFLECRLGMVASMVKEQ